MKKIGRRGELNQQSRKMIAKYCEQHGINSCENCGGTFGLAPAHRQNRIDYHTAQELANPKEWIALCAMCHIEIEGNRGKTEALFKRLRPDEKGE